MVEISRDPHTEDDQGSGESSEVSLSGESGIDCTANQFAHLRDVLKGSGAWTLRDGDIVIEYHPHSEKGTRILSPQEFKDSLNHHSDPIVALADDQPWQLFSTRGDFDFAELIHDTKLNQKQIEQLIKLIQRCQDTPGLFTLQKYNDLQKVLSRATNLLTQVTTF